MHLVLDIGNTRVKWAVYASADLKGRGETAQFSNTWLEEQLRAYPVQRALVCASGPLPDDLGDWLTDRFRWHILDMDSPLPFTLAYRTPETLGRDRIAAMAGALGEGFHAPLLVIDAGTCITLDFLDAQGRYQGGSIAPGIGMRARAMHEYTHRLPLVLWNADATLPGQDTISCLNAGAFLGAVSEIEGMVARYQADYGEMPVLLTGGDAPFLASRLKCPIFVFPDLVLTGLNTILNAYV